MFSEPTVAAILTPSQTFSTLTMCCCLKPHDTTHSTSWSFVYHAILGYVSVRGMAFTADGASGTAPDSSPEALLQHLQTLARVPAMQDKLQVLSDALPAAPQTQLGPPMDGSNWEGDADSKAWQYDCEVPATHAWC